VTLPNITKFVHMTCGMGISFIINLSEYSKETYCKVGFIKINLMVQTNHKSDVCFKRYLLVFKDS
jgi:hypothetical protein